MRRICRGDQKNGTVLCAWRKDQLKLKSYVAFQKKIGCIIFRCLPLILMADIQKKRIPSLIILGSFLNNSNKHGF